MSLENDYLGGSDPVYPEDGQSETSTAPNTMALRNDHEVPDYMYSATELLQADLRLWTPIYGQRHFSCMGLGQVQRAGPSRRIVPILTRSLLQTPRRTQVFQVSPLVRAQHKTTGRPRSISSDSYTWTKISISRT